MSIDWWIVFAVTFVWMEWMAWFLHKYVMHGFLWCLHEDHHVVDKTKRYQKNDLFAVFFAVPSFLCILFDSLYGIPMLGAFGYGVMAYGFAYFFVHEVIIHRRFRFIKVKNNWYVRAVNSAHKIHHSVRTKEGASNFGMLIVPLKYFKAKKA